MKKMLINAKTKITTWGINLITRQKKGDRALIIEIGLACVGVFLLIIFRDQMAALIKTLVNLVVTKIQNLFSTL